MRSQSFCFLKNTFIYALYFQNDFKLDNIDENNYEINDRKKPVFVKRINSSLSLYYDNQFSHLKKYSILTQELENMKAFRQNILQRIR